MGFRLNPVLAAYLQERRELIERGESPTTRRPGTPMPQRKRQPLTKRLSPEDMAAIARRYQAGMTARSLAAEYELSLTAVKKVLRLQGARKQ